MPVFQFFINVVTLFACKTNIHGAGIKYMTQLETQVGGIGLEIFIHADGSFKCSYVVNAEDEKRASIMAAIAWGIKVRISQKRLSSTNML